MISRQDFLVLVESLVGTPVVHMGRVPHKALDCVGVPWAACLLCGMDMSETPSYGWLPSEQQLAEGLALFCDRVEDGGHIWQVYMGRQARHVVVPVADGMVVHAPLRGGKVCKVPFVGAIAARWDIRGID